MAELLETPPAHDSGCVCKSCDPEWAKENESVSASTNGSTNGAAPKEPVAEKVEKVNRAQETAKLQAETLQKQAATMDALAQSMKRIEQLFADYAKQGVSAPAAAVASAAPEKPGYDKAERDRDIENEIAHRKMTKVNIQTGVTAYRLPITNPIEFAQSAVKNWEAYREHAGGADKPWRLELTTERGVEAMVRHAALKIGRDEAIQIHVSAGYPKLARQIVHEAVKQGISVANTDPWTRQLVAEELERIKNPLSREHSHERDIVSIERVDKDALARTIAGRVMGAPDFDYGKLAEKRDAGLGRSFDERLHKEDCAFRREQEAGLERSL